MLRIHSFESLGTFDGPGIRLVVFLQGCNFRCLYCANPDTIPIGKDGKLIEDSEVIRRAVSEKPFFGKKGGITFSGGEPTVQAAELIRICEALKAEDIHICLDTNGSIHNEAVYELWRLVDMVLLDCKQINPARHKLLTMVDNQRTLRSAEMLAEMGKPVRLRYVLVPEYSDAEEDLHALGQHFGGFDNIERLEILPYHTYGKHKYETLEQAYALEGVREPSHAEIERATSILSHYFRTVWTQ
ncbi:MAG: pyruvate formate-lyase-activating protein [Porphyromonadaceae bacterium]|nr:pyruvate formate-lyase-activating protein [Porphyromonadaceae bacterium]